MLYAPRLQISRWFSSSPIQEVRKPPLSASEGGFRLSASGPGLIKLLARWRCREQNAQRLSFPSLNSGELVAPSSPTGPRPLIFLMVVSAGAGLIIGVVAALSRVHKLLNACPIARQERRLQDSADSETTGA